MPFTAEEVLDVFNSDAQDSYASQVLMLYYVLYYHDCFLANLKRVQLFTNGETMVKPPSRFTACFFGY